MEVVVGESVQQELQGFEIVIYSITDSTESNNEAIPQKFSTNSGTNETHTSIDCDYIYTQVDFSVKYYAWWV